jgi:hypothetical protein
MVVGINKINDNKKCMPIAGCFDDHRDAVVQCSGHCLMEYIQGFSRSRWMPVINFGWKHKMQTEHNF